APVRARRLRVSPLGGGGRFATPESLSGGRARFAAENSPLRPFLDLAPARAPVFLLGEVLHRPNSHHRRPGAGASVRSLVQTGALGLVTTHDLALADLAEKLAPQIQNVHFTDHFANGSLTFDYRLRPGVVQTSNAVALMRAVGLEV